ncbi:MAG: hypothetical protein RML72_09225 [Bacteroidia bacterium]|nr:hypothetical protein [Bacteroidia bacterium]MDW8159038.1 hypothetical protein [Bacteroidia bacterium]
MVEVFWGVAFTSVLLFNFILFELLSQKWNQKIDQLQQQFEMLATSSQKQIENLSSHILELLQEQAKALENSWKQNTVFPTTPISEEASSSMNTIMSTTDNNSLSEQHTLALKVSEELHRMKLRVASMPPETKGLSALKNAIRRIEEQLEEQGYQITDYTGKPYLEGMNVEATFIPTQGFDADHPIITKVVRPQVSYKGELLRIASVEVAISG